MTKNVINSHITSHLSSVEKHLKLYGKRKGQEHIHHIRTDIKKIKALLSFLRHSQKDKSIPKVDSLRSFYKRAGKIRELQINIRLLKTLPAPPKLLIKKLEKDEATLTRQFNSQIPTFIKSVHNFKKTLELPQQLPKKRFVKKYFRKQVKKANAYLDNKKDKTDIHHLRAVVKKMMHIYNVLPKKLRKGYKLNTDYIKVLETKAGNWHDTFAAITFLYSKKLLSTSQLTIFRLKEEKQYRSLLLYLQAFKEIHNK